MDRLLTVLQQGPSFAESGAGSKKGQCSLTSSVWGFGTTCVSSNISVNYISTNSEAGMCSFLEICVKLNCIMGWFWCLFFFLVCLIFVIVVVVCLSLYFTGTENASSKGICWEKSRTYKTCIATHWLQFWVLLNILVQCKLCWIIMLIACGSCHWVFEFVLYIHTLN